MNERLTIFSGTSNPKLAQEICDYIGISLGKATFKRFSDGEFFVRLDETVRGNDVFIIQSTSEPANDNIMELMLMIDACKRASARRINAVIPYYGYGRQDRKVEPRVPISAKVVADMLEKVGASRVMSMDLHADQIQGFFSVPVDHMFAAPLLIDYFNDNVYSDKLTIVSPDSGGAERARFFAKQLHAQLAIIDKRRPEANVSEVMHVIGDIKGRDCILLDDMIDTAGTITKAATSVMENGASSVKVVATHGVLSGSAIKKLEESDFDEVILTNSIDLPKSKQISKIKVLSVAPLIGEAIRRIFDEKTVSKLFIRD